MAMCTYNFLKCAEMAAGRYALNGVDMTHE